MGRPIIGITGELEAARWGTWIREAVVSRIQLPHRAASSSPVMPMIGRPIRPPARKVPCP